MRLPACYRKAADVPDPSLSSRSHADGLPQVADDARDSGAAHDRLHDDLRRAGSVRAPELLDAALRLVTSFASLTVRGVDGVSITLDRHGRMMTVAGSDDAVRLMDEHQYATGEGPCLAAAAEGRSYHSASLHAEERWPTFVPRAVEQGIASILSTPLLVSTRSVGAINMYSCTEEVFGSDERKVAAFFAKRASDILGQAAELDEHQGARISDALTSREVIAMAQGVHMSRLGVSAEEAAAKLHRAARDREVTVHAEAVAVLDSTRTDGGRRGGHDAR